MAASAATVEAVVQAGGSHVETLMAEVEAWLGGAAGGHGDVLTRHAGETISAGGKRLRPLLVLVVAGPPAPQARDGLLACAAAVELVHSATLVHDDVLDAADLRRGRPTVVAAAGRDAATATGDLLFSRAFALLARHTGTAAVRSLSGASMALARGELLQRADAFDTSISIDRYLERCELKTARLFASACELGALHAGDADPARTAALAEFGRRIGVAFQLLDDVLDVAGPPERTGKAIGTDLLDGTVTLPLILARERDPQLAALDLRALGGAPDAAGACAAIAATGALDDARARALQMVAEAKAGLPEIDDRRRRALELVADGVVERYA
jgi:geranylgeranyl pyrophosphate synthase